MHRYCGLSLVVVVLVCMLSTPESGLAKAPPKRKVLYMTLSAGFHHQSVEPSEPIVMQMGDKSGAFETTVTKDVGAFTKENLKNFDAVMFYTTGELAMTDAEKEAFAEFIKSGHGFVGVHSATDTFYMWPTYLEIIGGYFNNHPWHQQVTVDVEDPLNKIVAPWGGKSFQINDEIYQISDFQYKTSHVLLKLDPSSVDLKKAGVERRFYGWPLAWTRTYGKGRVFYTGLGHEEAVWKDPRFQEMLLNALKWVMRETD